MKLNTSIRKRYRVSNKVKKVASNDRFRLSISRSTKNIFAQIIDDNVLNGRSVGSLEINLRDRIYQAQLLARENRDEAKVVAESQTRELMDLYTRGLT